MLDTLRRGAGSWIAKILFALLILSFAAWGIGDFLRPDPNVAVAEVGDTEIGQSEFTRAFQREYEQLRQRFGASFTREMATQLGLADQALQNLINRRLYGIEADALGLRIADQVVRERILEESAFRDPLGRFDRGRFEEVLRANGLSEGQFVELMRGDIARAQLADAVVGGVTVPESVAAALFRYRMEERVAEVLFIPNEKAGTAPEPTEADLKTLYEETKERWMSPEYRAVTAVFLRPEDLMAEVAVPEERLREAYEARQRDFGTPETRTVTQLLFKDEAAAKAAAERLAAGVSFDEVATAASAAGAERTEIGTVQRGDLFPAAVADAAFSLASEGTTAPVESPLGWHILRVTEIKPGVTKPFDEVREQLRADIAREIAADRIFEVANRLDDALAGGATLEEAAKTADLPVVRIARVDRSGRGPDGEKPADLPSAPGFLDAAFATEKGMVSQLHETADGGYFVLRVDDVVPRAQRSFEEVRDKLGAEWRKARLHEMAAKEAEAIAEKVRAGESLSALAAARGLEARTLPAFTRDINAPADRMPASLAPAFFKAAEGGVVTGAMDDGYVVARVAEIRRADPGERKQQAAQLDRELADAMRADLRAGFTEALRDRYGVSVNEAVVRSLF